MTNETQNNGQPQIGPEPMEAAGVDVAAMIQIIAEANKDLAQPIDNAERQAVLVAFAEYHKATVAVAYWKEKLQALKSARRVIDSMTEEEQEGFINIRIKEEDHLKEAYP